MKIAHIITRLVAGGAQRNTLSCAAYQQGQGHSITVIAGTQTSNEGSLLAEARTAAYRFVELETLNREPCLGSDLRALGSLVRLFGKERFDLVHTHTSKAGILGRIAAWSTNTPIIIHTPHGHVFHSYFSALKTRLFKLVEQLTVTLADATVFLTTQELADHLECGAALPNRSFVIPSGVNLQPFLELDCVSETFTVGYVGRLADIKGPLDLIEAFRLHVQGHPASRLLMVGDGPLREQVQQAIVTGGLQDCCDLYGWKEDIRPFLRRMSVLVVPSHNEAMGRVVVEAMAAGLPVIATSVGGLVDIVTPGRNGDLVPPNNPQKIMETLGIFAKHPEYLKRLGAEGRHTAVNFSEEVMFTRLEELYLKLGRLKGLQF